MVHKNPTCFSRWSFRAHDNLNLWDKIIKTQGLEDEEGWVYLNNGELTGTSQENYSTIEEAVDAANPHGTITEENVLENETVRRSLLSNGIVMTSQGIPFFHAGDEILRTKYGDHNSYRSPDAINQINWDDKAEYEPVYDYYKGLINLRKEHPAFRMSTESMVNEKLNVFQESDNLVAFELENNANGDKWNNIVVIYNGNETAKTVELPRDTNWNVVVNDKKAGTETLDTFNSASVNIEPLSVMVLYDEATDYTPTATTIELKPDKALIEVGDYLAINVVVRDQNGAIISNPEILWESSDESIVTVVNGRIQGISEGEATITARVGEISSNVEITVGEKVPTTIEIRGDNSVYTGNSKQLQARVLDQFDQELLGTAISWTSSDTSIATINSRGRVTGLTPGYVIITATIGSISAEYEIEVIESFDRYIDLTYIRNNHDYENWSLWLWQSGKSDGDVQFDEVTPEGASVRIPIGPES